jgi:hypothetical protein
MSTARKLVLGFSLLTLAAVATAGATAATGKHASGKHPSAKADAPVNLQVFAPRPGDTAGKASKGFFVDLAVQ